MSNKFYETLFDTLGAVMTDGTIQENNGTLLDKYKNFYQTNTNYDNSINWVDAGNNSINTSFGRRSNNDPIPSNTKGSVPAATILLAVALIAFLVVSTK